jgi:hypothetical protein
MKDREALYITELYPSLDVPFDPGGSLRDWSWVRGPGQRFRREAQLVPGVEPSGFGAGRTCGLEKPTLFLND